MLYSLGNLSVRARNIVIAETGRWMEEQGRAGAPSDTDITEFSYQLALMPDLTSIPGVGPNLSKEIAAWASLSTIGMDKNVAKKLSREHHQKTRCEARSIDAKLDDIKRTLQTISEMIMRFPPKMAQRQPEAVAINLADAAKMLSISRTSMYRLVSSGEIKSFTLLGRHLIAREEIERIVNRGVTDNSANKPPNGLRQRGRPRKVIAK